MSTEPRSEGAWAGFIGFFVDNKLVVYLMVLALVVGGLMVAPFRFDAGGVPRDPVPVDAIPDIGDNQQIVFTKWAGRSPRDVEDQVSYPLTTALLGIPGVRTVRTFSMFGFSSIYVIFEEDVEFYWSRSRILEKLASLPSGTLPNGVSPALGPDATALGQVYWYSLEGQDEHGNVVGGFSQAELRSVQDWTIRFALQGVTGVSEVASVGGYVKEYQIDLDPEALLAHGVSVHQVADAVRKANLDVGARTVEINQVEYIVRGLGFIRSERDLDEVVVANREHTPIRIRDVAKVTLGPAQRRGALDVEGSPAVGGVVVARFGANPMAAIDGIKAKIEEISPGLPRKTLEDGTVSQVKIVPFYDRAGLIDETLETLSTALIQQILITVIVVLIMLRNLRSSMLISMLLPLGMLGAFIGMKVAGVDANVMALSGIAIAIGTMVDMGIVFTENIVNHLELRKPEEPRPMVVRRAAAEVAPAVLTSVATTVVSFVPIFGLSAAEGKLFRPLAFTKSFAMVAALILSIVVLPPLAELVLRQIGRRRAAATKGRWHPLLRSDTWMDWLFVVTGLVIALAWTPLWGTAIMALAAVQLARRVLPERYAGLSPLITAAIAVVAVTVMLSDDWLPLGPEPGLFANRAFVALLIGGVMGSFSVFLRFYPRMLRFCLDAKWVPLTASGLIVLLGVVAWRGSDSLLTWAPDGVRQSGLAKSVAEGFPGLGREYMPPLDEGAFLYMPTTMPHASIGQAIDLLSSMDERIAAVPEVDTVAGKLGRVESPLDPAPVSMYETVITYLPEYRLGADKRRATFRYDEDAEDYVRDERGELIEDEDGRPFRQWRSHIKSPKDIWKEIQIAGKTPGVTSAPELMPIAARIIMLQSGMRAPMGLKIRGPDLDTIEKAGLQIEALLKQVPSVRAETVVADRIVGKPYMEIVIDREAIARHGITIQAVQNTIQTAIGGRTLTQTVEGRERYPVRVRYARERRDSAEDMEQILVPSPLGHQIPLGQLTEIRYVRGPQVIKSEDTFLVGYVVFDKVGDAAEVDVVEEAKAFLQKKRDDKELVLPAGVTYKFAGNYENQLRSDARLAILFPTALLVIFLILYFQFRSVSTTLIIFSGVLLGMAGGFVLLWLYGKPWFMDVAPGGTDMRTLFQVHTINMSVAVWVGFIALVGIATDNGVVLATYLHQKFEGFTGSDVEEIRERALEAGVRRARPCLMATGTTMLALLPVITSTGRGADVMVPMALPSLGGMAVALVTLFLVPVLFSLVKERAAVRATA